MLTKLLSPLTVKLEKPSYPKLGNIVYVTLLGVTVFVYRVGAALPDWTTIAKEFGVLLLHYICIKLKSNTDTPLEL